MPTAHTRPWHRDSTFGDGPRRPLDREQRAQIKAKLLLQRRPGRLTIAAAQVGRVMVDMLGADGRLDPSLTTIADKARVSVATVKRALVQLRECGFVEWTRRLVRDAAGGWRTAQTTSAYVLAAPACEVHFAPLVRLEMIQKEKRPLTDVENAARQILAIGGALPDAWARLVIGTS
jgi:hypothetical protein